MKMDYSSLELVGHVGVDSASVLVGDPIFFPTERPTFSNSPEIAEHVHYVDTPNGAFLVMSGWGDGLYPVYVQRNETGRIGALIVDFRLEDDEDDE